MMFRTITITALVGIVSANLISMECMRTLTGLIDKAACLKPSLLIPVVVGVGNSDQSIVGYLNEWLDNDPENPSNMCSSPACSEDTLSLITDEIHKGCSTEFAAALPALDFIRKNYLPLREVVCLKDGPTNCITDTLSSIESLIKGNMNLDENNTNKIVSLFKQGVPSEFLCTKCIKGIYTLLSKNVPGVFASNSNDYFKKTCGVAFVDGGIPPGLIAAASKSTSVPAPDSAYATTTTLALPTTSTTVAPTSTLPPTTATLTPTPTPTPTAARTKDNAAAGTPYLSSSAVTLFLGLIITAAEVL